MTKQSTNSRRRATWQIVLALAVCVPSRALAESPSSVDMQAVVLEAERYAALAFDAYGRRAYEEAVTLYEKAYEAMPSADALYNIARVYDLGLRDRTLAIEAYDRFLLDPGASPERIQRASERVRVLRSSARVATESAPAPAVAPAAAQSPVDAAQPDAPSHSGSALRVAALVSGAAGVAGVGLGIGFGLAVVSDADTANAGCVENRCSSQRAVNAAKSASTKATIATTGVCAGAALIVTGITLWLLDADSTTEQAPRGVQVTPVASTTELGMALGGRW